MEELTDGLWILEELMMPLLHHDKEDHDRVMLDIFHELANHENPSRVTMRLLELTAGLFQVISMEDGKPCSYFHEVVKIQKEEIASLS